MVDVPPSAIKVVSTDWLVLLIAALTRLIPVLVLVNVVLAKPFEPVIADAVVTVAPLFAVKVTATLGTTLPLASVTLA